MTLDLYITSRTCTYYVLKNIYINGNNNIHVWIDLTRWRVLHDFAKIYYLRFWNYLIPAIKRVNFLTKVTVKFIYKSILRFISYLS